MNHSYKRLAEHILPLSDASEFEDAKREWVFSYAEILDGGDMDNCPCGHEIKELCFIENNVNGNKTYVGNVCVNRFLGIKTTRLFGGLKRIMGDSESNANKEVIEYAQRNGVLFDGEYQFLMDTKNKRKLSTPQLNWKRKINERILDSILIKSGKKEEEPATPNQMFFLSRYGYKGKTTKRAASIAISELIKEENE